MDIYSKAVQIGKDQTVIFDYEHNKAFFQSYRSLVACYDKTTHTLTLGCDWDYSNTTKKYLYEFINTYVSIDCLDNLNQQSNKRAYIQSLIDNGTIKYDYNME